MLCETRGNHYDKDRGRRQADGHFHVRRYYYVPGKAIALYAIILRFNIWSLIIYRVETLYYSDLYTCDEIILLYARRRTMHF